MTQMMYFSQLTLDYSLVIYSSRLPSLDSWQK